MLDAAVDGGEVDKLLKESSKVNLSIFGNSKKLSLVGEFTGLEISIDSIVCDIAGFINSCVTAATAPELGMESADPFAGTDGRGSGSLLSAYIPKMVSRDGALSFSSLSQLSFPMLEYISKIVSRL